MTKGSAQLPTAIDIATQALTNCLLPIGIINGSHHFVDLWARDSFFASFGANAINHSKFTRATLELFFNHQRSDGLIPYRMLRSPTTISKYLGHPCLFKSPQPNYHSRQSGGLVYDGNPLVVIASRYFFDSTHDKQFLITYYPKIKLAADYLLTRFNHSLVWEWFQCEWADAIFKIGNVLYTNVLYHKALSDLAYICEILDNHNDKQFYIASQINIGKLINDTFWTGKYFADWFDYQRQGYFSSGSNMLAVWFGLADQNQSRQILNFAQNTCWNSFTLESNFPKYPFWRVSPLNHLTGMADYCNRGCLWLQPGIMYALSLYLSGQQKKASEILNLVASQIAKYQNVYEIYEKDGSPVDRFFYKSERSFAWSAGLFLYAASKIRSDSKGKSKSPVHLG